ncbi:ABC transporter permease [Peribacillus cavernae]|uniref:ABC transporter permease n=1 Tax=Peribacillus cavernae TaxID=1674310 RepID=A0A3S0V7Y6_9BACI|nr:ABC transporter permease [Peribacillus cavernae]MDQ0221402.1 peptide/nickel transport system permease protein [Peribacillus cavernae]RUQ25796.1 ABC transporter permease [Peribacillus cavernae]
MRIAKYLGKRLLTFIPLLIGVILVVFVLVRLLPGDPATRLAGNFAYGDTIAALRESMGLDKPIWQQFFIYLGNVLQGNLGESWFTNKPILDDLIVRFPATLELITLSILFSIAIGVPLGIVAAIKPKSIFSRISTGYGFFAGSIADFWFGLMLVFVFFTTLNWFPAPIGRLDLTITPPLQITGFLVIDSLLAGNWNALMNSIAHLALPVLTLGLINVAPIMKMTLSSMKEVMESDFINHAKVLGLSDKKVMRYALRNSLPSIVTILGVIYGSLLGGAVLVETVFGWGGLGQYVTQALVNKDYSAIQGFVLVATIFSLFIYLFVDLIYMIFDPRIKF